MRTTTSIATAVATLAALLSTTGAGSAATGYDARAHLAGDRSCAKTERAGVTRRTLVLDNRRSDHRVQYKVVRHGDRRADPVVHVWVPAHQRRSLTVSVPQRSTVSVRVRVPEMGRDDLRLSATVAALARCYVPTVRPRASFGGVACHGGDSVARIVLATARRATTRSTTPSSRPTARPPRPSPSSLRRRRTTTSRSPTAGRPRCG